MSLRRIGPWAFAALGVIAIIDTQAALAQKQVFRCAANGVVVFSDRPCGADAEIYRADDAHVSTYEAPPMPAPTPAKKRVHSQPNPSRESIAAAQAKHAESCARIDRSLRDISAKMRAGYDAKQGERLNERQRKLKEERRHQEC